MTRAALAALAALSLLAAPLARAADPADGATKVELLVGDALNLCQAGLARCPAEIAICDDPKVAAIALTGAGLELRGMRPGKTLCSTMSTGIRRLLAVTVKPDEGRKR